ncbi:homoserine O-acetyltransferase MetX [Kytococcus sp. Marseille-QA3725]
MSGVFLSEAPAWECVRGVAPGAGRGAVRPGEPGTEVRPGPAAAPTRRLLRPGPVRLESGELLRPEVAVRSWGPPPAADGSNVVVVLHALTGDSHVGGPGGPSHAPDGWWPDVIGPGRPLDTERLHVVAPDVLGGCSGTTGPASTAPDGRAWGSRFPAVTVRDQVAVEVAALQALGVRRVAHVIGASAGGMRALEWGLQQEVEVGHLCVVAAPAVASADLRAGVALQRAAVEGDPAWAQGDYHPGPGPVAGLALARRMAMLTYRSADGLERRFGDPAAVDPRSCVGSWLDHHGHVFVERFDPGAYLALSDAMAGHDVGRARGGVEAALAGIRARVTTVAVSSDRLVSPAEVRRVAAGTGGAYVEIDTDAGHDGFLIESEATGQVLREALA